LQNCVRSPICECRFDRSLGSCTIELLLPDQEHHVDSNLSFAYSRAPSAAEKTRGVSPRIAVRGRSPERTASRCPRTRASPALRRRPAAPALHPRYPSVHPGFHGIAAAAFRCPAEFFPRFPDEELKVGFEVVRGSFLQHTANLLPPLFGILRQARSVVGRQIDVFRRPRRTHAQFHRISGLEHPRIFRLRLFENNLASKRSKAAWRRRRCRSRCCSRAFAVLLPARRAKRLRFCIASFRP
jgi:hypothetical protein